VTFDVHVAAAPAGAKLSLAGNGARLVRPFEAVLGAAEAHRTVELISDGKARWVRFDVRSADGKLLLLGNPVYLRSSR
jgi:hypothetical protein